MVVVVIIIVVLLFPLIIKYGYLYLIYKQSGYTGHSFIDTMIKDDKKARGAMGELLICRTLKKIKNGRVVSNAYVYTSNDVSGEYKSYEIDVIFIHLTGIYVIESKNLKGMIKGDDKYPQWHQYIGRKKYEFINPLRQNRKHIQALNQLLDQQYNDKVFNFVVFSERCNVKKMVYDRTKARVCKINNLYKVIKRVIEKSPNVFTDEQVEYLYHKLEYATKVSEDAKLKHIEDITHKEDGVL